jgi:hypothetical protein
MASRAIVLASALLAVAFALPTAARTQRDPQQRALFVQTHPCPANSNTQAGCGYVVDHVVPLCAGGRDLASNMRWRPVAEAHAKDRERYQLCRRTKAKR